ncbi:MULTISPECIES: multicopper oxidase domain-containing protein [Streptomyces]|uniref:multicopper oxidase domain-containing protein n=1 Tax=Streptomyces TaxID=1883 RepID=UPI0033FFE5FF
MVAQRPTSDVGLSQPCPDAGRRLSCGPPARHRSSRRHGRCAPRPPRARYGPGATSPGVSSPTPPIPAASTRTWVRRRVGRGAGRPGGVPCRARPRRGRAGQWMLHCHNAYHGEPGMIALVAYQA